MICILIKVVKAGKTRQCGRRPNQLLSALVNKSIKCLRRPPATAPAQAQHSGESFFPSNQRNFFNVSGFTTAKPVTNMDRRLRSRGENKVFSGFTEAEMEKMERVLKESGEHPLGPEVFKSLTRGFNRSAGRAGKPVVKWTDVQCWFLDAQQGLMSKDTSLTGINELPAAQEACALKDMNETSDMSKGEKVPDLSKLEFEAKSSDDAWYDVETFITHRFLSTGEPEVLVRYIGFGTEEDEWVNVKNVRERSVPLEHTECNKVMIGDTVLCFQEKSDEARYYDAQVIDIQRKLHDIRGCRCIFFIRYEHDNSEESVRLKRLCCRPEY